MKQHLDESDLALVEGLVHRVAWSTYRSFETLCHDIIENYQPEHLLRLNDGDPDYKLDERVAKWVDPNEPITCLRCLFFDEKIRVKTDYGWAYE